MLSEFKEKCLKNPGRILFPEADDPRVKVAAKKLLAEESFSEVWIPKGYGNYGTHEFEYTESILESSGEILSQGKVDTVIAGAKFSTAEVIRAALKSVGLAKGCKTVSGCFVMSKGEQLFIFSDCGVVIDPTIDQLCDIAYEAANLWNQLFKSDPKISFLSFSTKGSSQHEDTEKIVNAVQKFQMLHPDIDADGELQLDAAIIPEVAKRKCPDSLVGGKANILIFPNLNAGNIGYKLVERLGGYSAVGPILLGTAKPYVDLSRGCSVQDILDSAYINLLRSSGRS